MKNRFSCFLFLFLCYMSVFAQDDFVLGTDMGWLTQYESQGWKCFDRTGKQREAMSLMSDYGITAQRIRVWVDPSSHGGWCGKEDVLAKCLRAKSLGQDIMIDFHYSDWWADPGKQNIPNSWKGHSFRQMKKDLAAHTKDVLTMLKDNGIEPRWVQVGNETSNGMLWSVKMDPKTGWEWKDEHGKTQIVEKVAHLPEQPKQYAGFIRAGYDAVKEVFPNALVIVHLDNGFDNKLYNYNLDILVKNGGKFDMVGMSIYPYWSMQSGKEPNAEKAITDCITNMNLVSRKYGVDVMITETGFEVNEKKPEVMEQGRDQLRMLINYCRKFTYGRCRGVFYWEPECRPSQYKLGAFTEDGHPTVIMNGFLEKDLDPYVPEPVIVPSDTIVSTTHQKYSYVEMLEDLDSLQSRYPLVISYQLEDTTSQGRRIPVVRFGGKDAKRHIMVTGSIHAREYMSTQLVMSMMEHYARGYNELEFEGMPIREIFDSVAVIIVPMANPDGVEIAQRGEDGCVREETKTWLRRQTRKESHDQIKANANGVDINRNFGNGFGNGRWAKKAPSLYYYAGTNAFSEVESRQLLHTSSLHDYLCFVNYHSKGNNVYYGCQNAEAFVNEEASRMADVIFKHTAYPLYGPDSAAPCGSWADEVEVRYKRPSVTIEIGTKNPVPLEEFQGIYDKNLWVWADICKMLM